MAPDSRQKMIASAALLIRERGLAGTSFRDVVAHSGAPRGSIYHHFPGGKNQLAKEAVDFAGRLSAHVLGKSPDDPVGVITRFIERWAKDLEATEFRAGCPIVAVTTEVVPADEAITEAAGQAFGTWQDVLADGLVRNGVEAARARSLANLVIASIEGAVLVSRAQRDTAPLLDIRDELVRALESALPAA